MFLMLHTILMVYRKANLDHSSIYYLIEIGSSIGKSIQLLPLDWFKVPINEHESE